MGEGGVLDEHDVPDARPRLRRGRLTDDVAHPVLGAVVGTRQLGEREGLPNPAAELGQDGLDEQPQMTATSRLGADRVQSAQPPLDVPECR